MQYDANPVIKKVLWGQWVYGYAAIDAFTVLASQFLAKIF